MVTEVEMTVWIRLVQCSEMVKDQDVNEVAVVAAAAAVAVERTD